jgi:hypothetical protein
MGFGISYRRGCKNSKSDSQAAHFCWAIAMYAASIPLSIAMIRCWLANPWFAQFV